MTENVAHLLLQRELPTRSIDHFDDPPFDPDYDAVASNFVTDSSKHMMIYFDVPSIAVRVYR